MKNNLLEFDVIIYLKDDNAKKEANKLRDMGIEVPEVEEKEEKIAKYSFNPSEIYEYRQTYVKYKGDILDAVTVTFTSHLYETPALLIHYDEFKERLKQWNENNQEIIETN